MFVGTVLCLGKILMYAPGALESFFSTQLYSIKWVTTMWFNSNHNVLAPSIWTHERDRSKTWAFERHLSMLLTMDFNSNKITRYGDCFFDISKTDKHLIRATLKTCKDRITRVFDNVQKVAEDCEFEQKIWLMLQEFGFLVKTADKKIKVHQESASKDFWSFVWVICKLFQGVWERNQIDNFWRNPADIMSLTSHAVCPHFDSDFCQLPINLFNVLLDSYIEHGESMKQIKCYWVPRLFTTSKHFF